jgi:hypothetical protein
MSKRELAELEKMNCECAPPKIAKQSCYLTTLARGDSKETCMSVQKKCKNSTMCRQCFTSSGFKATSQPLTTAKHAVSAGSAAPAISARRTTISYLFWYNYGAPLQDEWKECKVVLGIMKALNIPMGSSAEVQKVLLDTLDCIRNEEEYDPDADQHRKGRKALIADGSVETEIIYRALSVNQSKAQITCLVNQSRAMRGLGSVSYSAVHTYVANNPCISRSRRLTKKSGKDDAGSVWAQARLQQCQWRRWWRPRSSF